MEHNTPISLNYRTPEAGARDKIGLRTLVAFARGAWELGEGKGFPFNKATPLRPFWLGYHLALSPM